MNNRRISIIFCGGCNPRINRGQIAAEVQNVLLGSGYQVCYNSLDVDFVIYISGCTAGCALKYNHSKLPAAVIAASSIDAVSIDEAKIVTEVTKKVRGYFE
ncbi:MAG: hypothetical protein H6Q72_4548 [Firmicutes bacterium]|nr:hypothetical protein [Bacillota bacterium]